MDYEVVIGLEIHVQLQTKSKMFSSSGTDFGLPPNTQTDPVSLGLPGTLPVMNRKAFELALKTALGLGARSRRSRNGTGRITITPICPKIIKSASSTCHFHEGGRSRYQFARMAVVAAVASLHEFTLRKTQAS